MTVSEMAKKLELTVFSGNNGLVKEVTGGYVSDLLSDVMGNANEGDAWITLQTHKNTMAIASLKDLVAIIVVNGLIPSDDTILQSNNESIPVLGTQKGTFEIAGKLYQLLQQ
jgi:predicted transcriptional regulator